jgi:UDP-glucose:glycoprotein glucosyltransferase
VLRRLRCGVKLIRQVVGPIDPSSFDVDDLDALEVFEMRKRVKPVIDLLRTMYDDITIFDR